jgi:cytochrome c oxidase subunit 2
MYNIPIVPPQASEHAVDHDYLFYAITALTIFFTVVVLSAVVYFAVKYRDGSNADRSNPVDHSDKLEIAWSVVPLVLALAMFGWGAKQWIDLHETPEDAIEIFVIGKQWMWHVQHANGVRENNELHVPVGRPVRLTMISQDVIHAFYIPAFRLQWHVVPGRYTSMWFTPTKTGRFNLWCAMHCGALHSEMGGYVTVMKQADFQAWLANGGSQPAATRLTMADQGKKLYEQLACGNCHGAQDNLRGPSLYMLYGKDRLMADGSKVKADEEYIRDSIVNPWARITRGYTNTMPAYKDALSEEQVLQLLAFIKTLGVSTPTPIAQNDVAQVAVRADATPAPAEAR